MKLFVQMLTIAIGMMILTSCSVGNGHICGPQTPSAYCNKEMYESLVHPKPYLQQWEKSEMASENRKADSAECGGGFREANAPSFTEAQLKAAREVGERDDFASGTRLFHMWERCMLKKGYRFTGQCFENEISKASPACGAP